jgi:hypothetical protein
MCFGSAPTMPDIPKAPPAPKPPEPLARQIENPEAAGTGKFGRRRRGKGSLVIPRRGLSIPS